LSENVIRYDPTRQGFFFDGKGPWTAGELAMLIGQGSRHGIDQVCQGGVTVSAGYVNEMLIWTRDHGWFIDVLEDTDDHSFDPDKPTPGPNWGMATNARRTAERMQRQFAARWRLARLSPLGSRKNACLYALQAIRLERRGELLQETAELLLHADPALDR